MSTEDIIKSGSLKMSSRGLQRKIGLTIKIMVVIQNITIYLVGLALRIFYSKFLK